MNDEQLKEISAKLFRTRMALEAITDVINEIENIIDEEI